jgi:hypothetical protein
MTSPISLPDLAQAINGTSDPAEAGRLMLQAKAALLVTGGIGWTKWVAASLERSERAAQRCITAAREEAADKERKSLVTPVDLVLAQGALPPADPVVGKPTETGPAAEPAEAEPQTFVDEPDVGKPTVDLPLAEATTQIVDDIADTLPGDVAYPTEADVADFDVAFAELADEPIEAEPPGGKDADSGRHIAVPEPLPLPRAARKMADAWLELPTAWLREQCLEYAAAGCPDWGPFISSPAAAAASQDFREAAFYANPEVRASFCAWTLSLPKVAA